MKYVLCHDRDPWENPFSAPRLETPHKITYSHIWLSVFRRYGMATAFDERDLEHLIEEEADHYTPQLTDALTLADLAVGFIQMGMQEGLCRLASDLPTRIGLLMEAP